MIKMRKITVNAFQEHTYLVFDEDNNCVIIDPGCSNEKELSAVEKYISENNLKPQAIWHTHLHFDHTMATAHFARLYNIPAFCHRDDLPTFDANRLMAAKWGFEITADGSVFDHFVTDGDKISIGNDEFTVLHVPGHSPGGVAFYSAENQVCFCGDTLFRMSVGRTDLPGGDENELLNSIKTKLFTLPDDTLLCCGHGDESNVGFERQYNPYCGN